MRAEPVDEPPAPPSGRRAEGEESPPVAGSLPPHDDGGDDLRDLFRRQPVTTEPPGAFQDLRAWGRRHPLPAIFLASVLASLGVLLVRGGASLTGERAQGERVVAHLRAEAERLAQAARHAEAGRLVAEARRVLADDPTLSLHLALAAAKVEDGTPVREALREIVPRQHEVLRLHGFDGSVEALALDPVRPVPRVVAADATGLVTVWDLDRPTLVHRLLGHEGPVRALAVDPRGDWVASGGADGTVRVWDMATGGLLRRVAVSPAGVRALAPTPDGSTVLAARADGGVAVVRVEGQDPPRVFAAETAPADDVAVAPSGEEVAVLVRGGLVERWSLATRERRATYVGVDLASPIEAWPARGRVVYDPAGTHLVTWCPEGVLRAWALADGRKVLDVGNAREACTAFALGRTRIVARLELRGTGPAAALVIDLETGEPLRQFGGLPSMPLLAPVALDAEGDQVALPLGAPARVDVRRLDDGTRLALLEGHAEPVTAMVFLADPPRLLTASRDATVRVWDLGSATGEDAPAAAATPTTPASPADLLAVARARRTVPVDPRDVARFGLGDPAEFAREWVDAQPSARSAFDLGRLLLHLGRVEDAARRFAEAEQLRPDLLYGAYGEALVQVVRAKAALSGTPEREAAENAAIAALERTLATGQVTVEELRGDDALGSVRSLPAFQRLRTRTEPPGPVDVGERPEQDSPR